MIYCNIKGSDPIDDKYTRQHICILKMLVVPVMQESQAHGSLEVSQAVVVGVDEVKGQRPLDGTTASAWSGTYQAAPRTDSML